MSKIEWNNSFSVNVPEIDEQHKKWIGMINELHAILLRGDLKENMEISSKVVAEIRDYTLYHFTTEEKLMKEINFPDLPSHKDIHNKFYMQVKELYYDINEGKTVLNTEIMNTLTNWLSEHILNEDKKLLKFIPGK